MEDLPPIHTGITAVLICLLRLSFAKELSNMLVLAVAAPLLLGFIQAATPQAPANPSPSAQSSTVTTLANSPTPTDPKELLELGRKVNGLVGPDVQPWHLKASFETFDDDGKSKDKGTYEEWWVSEKRYKRSYTSTDFSQTEYGTDHGAMRTGTTKWPSGSISLIRRSLIQPLPSEAEMPHAIPESTERSFGSIKLRCVEMTSKVPLPPNAPPLMIPSYCFNLEKPILRYASTYSQTAFNRILLFAGRYLGGDIDITTRGKEYLKIHIDLSEPLTQINTADFEPPLDAAPPPPRRINVSNGVAQDNILTKVPPIYPEVAKARHIQGTVVVQATISETGHIRELKVVSGPPELQQAALDAVRHWVYKPYLLNGEAVEVGTTINVVFSLGGR